jgi:acyl carrier protein
MGEVTPELRERVFASVRRCIVESLAVEPEAVGLESRLIDDLGADSLDFVDIVFMLDHELDIRVRESEFNFITRLDFSSPEVMTGEFLTEGVIARLETWLPALARVEDRTKVTPRQLFSLITVESICIVAEQRLAEPGTAKA